MEGIGRSISELVALVIGVAIIAVVLSNGANTVNVITSFFNGLSSLIRAAVSPVTGGNSVNLSSGGGTLPVSGSITNVSGTIGNANSGGVQGSISGLFNLGGGSGVAVNTGISSGGLIQSLLNGGSSGGLLSSISNGLGNLFGSTTSGSASGTATAGLISSPDLGVITPGITDALGLA